MPEEKDKNIHFKILTAEHLLEEKESELKKIEPPAKEEIKPEVIEKIEVEKGKAPEKEMEEIKVVSGRGEIKIEPQLTNLYYPQEETPKTPPFLQQPIETAPIESPIERITQTKPKPETIEEPAMTEKTETVAQPQIQLETKQETKIFYEKPLPEALPKETAAPKVKVKPKFFSYLIIAGGIIVLVFLIIYTKPYVQIKKLISKSPKEKTTAPIVLPPVKTTVEVPAIKLPEIKPTATLSQPSTPTISETTTPPAATITPPAATITPPAATITLPVVEETTPKKEEPIVSQPKAQETFSQQTFIYPSKEISFTNEFIQREINLKALSFDEFEKQLKDFLLKQELAGTFLNLNINFGNRKVPFNFVFDFFIKPQKISSAEIEKFRNEFMGNFAFMLYYTYTRKYPLLIFEIKNPSAVKTFNQKWEKLGMSNDLKTLFLGFKPGNPLRNYFVTKEIKGIAYRVLYFDNNYKLIWTTFGNFLIYSASESALSIIANYLK